MLDAALAAAAQIFSKPFRSVFWKTILLTLASLALAWAGFERLLASVRLPYAWLETALAVVGGLGLFVGAAFLVSPVSFFLSGFFFDELAAHVEEGLSPRLAGRTPPLGAAAKVSLEFALASLLVNVLALLLLLAPGVNAVAFLGANAYLFGRGYFELAALRFLPPADVSRLRRDNGPRLFFAGLVVAALAAIPVANLLTPLFAAAFMTRIAAPMMRTALAAPRRDAAV
ncbi:EI24 domain-containing protein [Methylocella sp.]|uniref:EI24 domain-containing protein n=1 Tax=Methylocella sp. TaxID=1978226 RepID=UPI0035ADC66B